MTDQAPLTPEKPFVVTRNHELIELVDQCTGKAAVALDAEANGLHAFRARLCVLQIAWRDGDNVVMAVIDTLELNLSPLAKLLSNAGPVKIVHDLTFDARILQERGITLGRVRDTSVAARFLGESSTGLASLVEANFDVKLSKFFQEHDWSQRPFTSEQLEYLTGDVRYLFDLDELLSRRASELDIAAEVATECDYKLLTALRPTRREGQPAWASVKGHKSLDALGTAILRELVNTRTALAETADLPPFRIAPNGLLLEIARKRIGKASAIRRLCGKRKGAARHTDAWSRAVHQGTINGAPPPEELAALEPKRLPRAESRERKAIEKLLNAWRRREANTRNVDVQVILPGHCCGPVAAALWSTPPGDHDALVQALDAVEGFGSFRTRRYGPSLGALVQEPQERSASDTPQTASSNSASEQSQA